MTPKQRALNIVNYGRDDAVSLEKEIKLAIRGEQNAIISELLGQGKLLDNILGELPGHGKHWPLLRDIVGIIQKRKRQS